MVSKQNTPNWKQYIVNDKGWGEFRGEEATQYSYSAAAPSLFISSITNTYHVEEVSWAKTESTNFEVQVPRFDYES